MKPLVLTLLSAFLLTACGSPGAGAPVSDARLLLGTLVSVTLRDENPQRGAIAAVFERTEEIQNLMSANAAEYDDTEILSINRAEAATAVPVSRATLYVISEALEFARITGGAFDITVHPLIELWGFGTEFPAVPPQEEIDRALALRGWQDVTVDAEGGTVALQRPGMSIDVGGIAKGYAADEGARVLRELGVQRAILDFGGDIVTVGERAPGTPWRIGIQHPSGDRSRILGILASRDEAVVSSGYYERYFEVDGVRYHHIFDPETGYPADSGLTSVTVVGPSAIRTDALSTAFFVMGLEASLELLADLPDYQALFSTTAGEVVITAGLKERFELHADDHVLNVR